MGGRAVLTLRAKRARTSLLQALGAPEHRAILARRTRHFHLGSELPPKSRGLRRLQFC